MADAAVIDAPEAEPHAGDHGHGDDHHDHHPALAHHFEDLDQQFDAGKLGMWLFLAQEVLFFSGLFAAYTVYRWNHPEVFVNAHVHLNTTLGAINTVVLLASSLAIAWGVRAAMRNDRRTILDTHVFTLGCASLFMGIKAIEYTHKWDEGIGAGSWYTMDPATHTGYAFWGDWTWGSFMPALAIGSLVVGGLVTLLGTWVVRSRVVSGWLVGSIGVCILSFGFGIVLAKCIMPTEAELAMQSGHGGHGGHAAAGDHGDHGDSHATHAAADGESHGDHDAGHATESDHSTDDHSAGEHGADEHGAEGHRTEEHGSDEHAAEGAPAEGEAAEGEQSAEMVAEPPLPKSYFGAANFFSIYFIMTGVHAVHIVGGIIAILWVVGKAADGQFDSEYFLPVENVGLYWHLVDLVWIYLFPLMYLIH